MPVPDGVEVVETPTAADVEREARNRSAAADVVVMAAAVADYRPSEPIEGKRAKTDEAWKLELERTVDVLAALGERERNGQVLVGFGAETGKAGLDRKRRMLTDKNLDLVVYNDVSVTGIGFDAPENEVTLLTRSRRAGASARLEGADRRRDRRRGRAPARGAPWKHVEIPQQSRPPRRRSSASPPTSPGSSTRRPTRFGSASSA